jgi:HEAT repeat protein
MVKGAKAEQRIAGVNLVGRRRMATAVPALVTAASDPDAKVRASALQRLERLGTPAEVPDLVKLVLRTTAPQDLSGLTDALSSICTQAGSPAAATDQIITALGKAQPAQKSALLGVLGAVGGNKALASVQAALKDAQPEIQKSALQALASWPDTAAMPELLRIVRAGGEGSERGTALRGYVRLARESNASAEDKLKQLSEAATLATNPQEKMLVLAGLGDIPSVDALKLAASHLSDETVAQEASAVAVKIAEKLDPKHGTDIGPVLNQVLKTTKSTQVQAAARKRLNQLKLPIE